MQKLGNTGYGMKAVDKTRLYSKNQYTVQLGNVLDVPNGPAVPGWGQGRRIMGAMNTDDCGVYAGVLRGVMGKGNQETEVAPGAVLKVGESVRVHPKPGRRKENGVKEVMDPRGAVGKGMDPARVAREGTNYHVVTAIMTAEGGVLTAEVNAAFQGGTQPWLTWYANGTKGIYDKFKTHYTSLDGGEPWLVKIS
nr:hypothetical protein [Chromobacterium sp. ASV5]